MLVLPFASSTQEIECSAVLLAVDEFFRQLGLTEIRNRSNRDDKPLRMVKTLLHELCRKKVSVLNITEVSSVSEEGNAGMQMQQTPQRHLGSAVTERLH